MQVEDRREGQAGEALDSLRASPKRAKKHVYFDPNLSVASGATTSKKRRAKKRRRSAVEAVLEIAEGRSGPALARASSAYFYKY